MFVAIVFPNSRKIFKQTEEGIHEFLIKGQVEEGIWVFEEKGLYAEPVRRAELHERAELFEMLGLPQVGVLPVVKTSVWFCSPLNENQYEKYVKVKCPLPLLFAPENLSVFDPIYARVYKHRRILLLYEDLNPRYPIETIERLRSVFENAIKTKKVEMKGFPKELKKALMIAVEAYETPLEKLVKESLKIVGAKLVNLKDLGRGQYLVEYEYEGREDSVVVDDSLFVLDAGICLSGREHDFDLSSIVLVKHRYYEERWD